MIGLLTTIFFSYYLARVPEHLRHEDVEEARARISLISYSIARACESNPIPGWPFGACVALAGTAAKWESGLMRDVHAGTKLGPSGELCLFQIHPNALASDPAYRITKEEWNTLGGLDAEATVRCAAAGVKTLAYHIHRCHIGFENGGWVAAARVLSEYHLPSAACRASISRGSVARAMDYRGLYRKLNEGAVP